jgi:putative tryptophan/tyrosine transport system substrate-binding protein
MRRREFCLALSAVTATIALSARAQKPRRPVIGCLALGYLENGRNNFASVRHGLAATGCVEGRDFDVEFRAADYQADRLRELAADLVERNVAVIVTLATPCLMAAQSATKSIPIVFYTGVDPVENGFVSSLNHPGGNATGIFTLGTTLNTKRLELLHEIAPTADAVAILMSPAIGSPLLSAMGEVTEAATKLGIRAIAEWAKTRDDFAAAFDAIIRDNCRALLVPGDAVFNNDTDAVVALAAKFRIPAMYAFREYVVAGGLASYGPDFTEGYRVMGTYAARILRGESPSNLPVQQITKVEFVLNARAAKGLDLRFPSNLLARADEVIE